MALMRRSSAGKDESLDEASRSVPIMFRNRKMKSETVRRWKKEEEEEEESQDLAGRGSSTRQCNAADGCSEALEPLEPACVPAISGVRSECISLWSVRESRTSIESWDPRHHDGFGGVMH